MLWLFFYAWKLSHKCVAIFCTSVGMGVAGVAKFLYSYMSCQ